MRRWRDSQEFASPRLCSATLATEGDPIERVHALVGPNCTIGAELDPHGHPTPERVHHAGIVVLYKEFPHIDVVERAEDLLTLVPRTIRGEIRPIMSLYDCRQVGGYPTTLPPMRAFVDKTAAMEGTDGVLPVSIGHCFPYAGVPELSGRILATTDGGKAKADRLATAIGEEPAGMRGKTPPEPVSVEAGIAAALRRDCWQSFGPTQVPVGNCAAIGIGGVEVVPIANRTQALGLELFCNLDIEPVAKKRVAVKSANHFMTAFGPIAEKAIYRESDGPLSRDCRKIPYTRVNRPIWPLDAVTSPGPIAGRGRRRHGEMTWGSP